MGCPRHAQVRHLMHPKSFSSCGCSLGLCECVPPPVCSPVCSPVACSAGAGALFAWTRLSWPEASGTAQRGLGFTGRAFLCSGAGSFGWLAWSGGCAASLGQSHASFDVCSPPPPPSSSERGQPSHGSCPFRVPGGAKGTGPSSGAGSLPGSSGRGRSQNGCQSEPAVLSQGHRQGSL